MGTRPACLGKWISSGGHLDHQLLADWNSLPGIAEPQKSSFPVCFLRKVLPSAESLNTQEWSSLPAYVCVGVRFPF